MTEEKTIDDVRDTVNAETSKIGWRELERFFASGATVLVSQELDLVDVAAAMTADDSAQFKAWMESGLVGGVDDETAAKWHANDETVWCVVIRPWVLVQDLGEETLH